ncbi:hypothetical protein NP493_934g00050 [Ridgeia piscesae]|uniref:inorganic diphosphatase n=1 Tax=Ridgeia piscesae TaxID=27915 RepID=A0AAD9KKB7_RIDPI|nr:hypothetical protein NP493_934g00050 [Ridgeia piscesae]
MPGFLKATNEWFRIYKIPAGKPENQFAFNGEAKNKSFALTIIKQANTQWQQLIKGQSKTEGINCDNTTVSGSPGYLEQDVAQKEIENSAQIGNAAPIDAEVDKWYYPKL